MSFFLALWYVNQVSATELSLPALNTTAYSKKDYIQQQTADEIALRLGWVNNRKINNLCHGYYLEPNLYYDDHTDLLGDKRPIRISFEESEYSPAGVSVFSGKVIITQPNRQLIADITHMNHDEVSNKFSEAELHGNIEWREPGKHLTGEHGYIDFKNDSGYLTNVLYRLTYKQITDEEYLGLITDKPQLAIDDLSAWGSAKQIARYNDGVIEVTQGTYTACPPTDKTWKLKASHFTLDNRVGKGKAKNATLYLRNLPIFYAPYLQFPLDKRRKTGFLFPIFGITSTGGYEYAMPFYWNIATNYDLTLTPNYMTERGLQLNGQMRYLTNKSNGNLHGAILPDDREFAEFRQRNLDKFPPGTESRSRLKSASNTRTFVSFQEDHQYNEHWNSYLYLNHVSDDYYFMDFKDDPAQITENQLINEARISYLGKNWAFATNLLAYQTLHPVNQAPVNNQYQKLPEVILNGHFPEAFNAMDIQVNNSAVYFNKNKNPGARVDPVTGGRLEVNPILSFPMYWASGYFNPQFQLSLTHYHLKNQVAGQSSDITRITPITNVDSGLIFERDTDWLGIQYKQTFEPRLFYLYVPSRNQSEIPLFDTSLQPFTYSQLFRTNRFTGLDRIGDANQVTLALSTRYLLAETGEEKLKFSVGEIFYFKDRQVRIKTNVDPDIVTRVMTLPDDTNVSPIVGELDFQLLPHLKFYSLTAWDPNTNMTNNASLAAQYKTDRRHLINFGINYTRGGDPEKYSKPLSNRNDLYQPDFSFVWPINQRITTLGHWNYNVSHGYTQTVFGGVQYDSCCWAFRIIGGREFLYQKLSLGSSPQPVFDTRIFFELVFKGLGKLSYENSEHLLSQRIAGFQETLAPFS